MIENLFTEEKRIQRLINEAVYEKQQELEKVQEESREAKEVNRKNQAEIERLKAKIKELEDK